MTNPTSRGGVAGVGGKRNTSGLLLLLLLATTGCNEVGVVSQTGGPGSTVTVPVVLSLDADVDGGGLTIDVALAPPLTLNGCTRESALTDPISVGFLDAAAGRLVTVAPEDAAWQFIVTLWQCSVSIPAGTPAGDYAVSVTAPRLADAEGRRLLVSTKGGVIHVS